MTITLTHPQLVPAHSWVYVPGDLAPLAETLRLASFEHPFRVTILPDPGSRGAVVRLLSTVVPAFQSMDRQTRRHGTYGLNSRFLTPAGKSDAEFHYLRELRERLRSRAALPEQFSLEVGRDVLGFFHPNPVNRELSLCLITTFLEAEHRENCRPPLSWDPDDIASHKWVHLFFDRMKRNHMSQYLIDPDLEVAVAARRQAMLALQLVLPYGRSLTKRFGRPPLSAEEKALRQERRALLVRAEAALKQLNRQPA